MGGGRKKSKRKKKTYSKAQQMARKRLGLSTPGESTSTGGNNSGVSGIGPVSSGDSYASSLGNQRVTSKGPSFSVGMNNNLGITSKSIKTSTPKGTSSQFSRGAKGTTGVGPVASGDKYASMLKQSPPRFSSANNSLLAGGTGFGLRPDGVTGPYKEGDTFTSPGVMGGKDTKYQYQGEPGNGGFVKLAGLPSFQEVGNFLG